MKKRTTIKTVLAGFGILALFSCQQVPQVSSNGNYVDPAPASGGVKLCSDGTLNCYVTVTNTTTIQPVDDMPYNQTFSQCTQACLATTDHGVCTTDLNAAPSACPDKFDMCESECSVAGTDSGPYGGLPKSDPITLPENPRAVFVDVTACYDEQAPYEIHFRGPDVSYHTPIEGTRSTRTGLFGIGLNSAKLGYGASRVPSSKCGDLRNIVNVKFTPVAENSVTLGDQKITVIPFDGVDAIEKNYAMPHSMAFGIPAAIRDLVDLSQVTWVLKQVGTTDPEMGKNSIWGFRFYNNDVTYGESVVFLDYTVKFLGSPVTKQTVTMALFMKSKE